MNICASCCLIIVSHFALSAVNLPSVALHHHLSVGVPFEDLVNLAIEAAIQGMLMARQDEGFVKELWCIFQGSCSPQVVMLRQKPVLRTDMRSSARSDLIYLRSPLAGESCIMVYTQGIYADALDYVFLFLGLLEEHRCVYGRLEVLQFVQKLHIAISNLLVGLALRLNVE